MFVSNIYVTDFSKDSTALRLQSNWRAQNKMTACFEEKNRFVCGFDYDCVYLKLHVQIDVFTCLFLYFFICAYPLLNVNCLCKLCVHLCVCMYSYTCAYFS